MAVRTLDSRSSLLTLLPHASYTVSCLQARPLGAPYVARFEELRARGMQVLLQEIALEENRMAAQARIGVADEVLDLLAARVSNEALALTRGDRSHALYQFFFSGKSLSRFVKPVLGRQLQAMKAWRPWLSQCPHPSLTALVPELEAAFAEADGALAARATARQQIREFRELGARQRWVNDLNAARKEVHGSLAKLPHQQPGLPSDFADHFFLSAPPREREREKEAPADPETVEGVRAQLAAQRAAVVATEARLQQMEAAEAAARKAAEARAVEEAALADLDRAVAEMERKRAAIRARLAATSATSASSAAG